MESLNDQMGWRRFILPDIYAATSVKDMQDNIGGIRRPPKWSIRNNLSGIGYPGHVLILLYNVNLEFDGDETYRVSDQTSELSVSVLEKDMLHRGSNTLEEIQQSPGKYSEVYLLHQPWSSEGHKDSFYGAMRHRASVKSKSWIFDISTNPILMPEPVFE